MEEEMIMGTKETTKATGERGRYNDNLPAGYRNKECLYNFCIGRYVRVTAFEGKVRII